MKTKFLATLIVSVLFSLTLLFFPVVSRSLSIVRKCINIVICKAEIRLSRQVDLINFSWLL